MRNTQILLLAGVSFIAADLLSLLLFLGGYISNLTPIYLIIFSALFLMIFGVRAVIIYSVHTYIGKFVLFMTVGGVIGFFGEFHTTLTLYAGEGIKPFGLDDLFYTPALILMGIGFFYAVRGNKMMWTPNKKAILATWSALLFLLLVVVYFLAGSSSLETVGVSIGYLIFSSALCLVALRVFMATWEYRGGLIFKAWFGIFLGICLLIATIFSLFMIIGLSTGTKDLAFIPLCLLAASEVALAYGFSVLGSITKNIQERVLKQI